jgi:four helix bundle protein
MEKARQFTDLKVWQKAHALVLKVYRLTAAFPDEEKFGLVAQLRRAAVSIAANLAEGFKKRTRKDKANFYNTSQGSLEEVRYYLILSRDLGLEGDFERHLQQADEIGKMLTGLIKSLEA